MPLRVIDVGTQVAGPFVATILGDLGADVIKCEQPVGGDPLRLPGGMSARWQTDGRNKRSCTLNLRVEPGQALLKRLVESADVLVENFRPGTMARWGLAYDDLRAVNPRLVYVSVSGFGQTGPYATRPAYHSIGAAFGGITHLTGFADAPPATPGPFLTDYIAGLFGAIGALEAIRRRDEPGGTGRGEWIDAALYESVMRLAAPEFAEYSLTGTVRGRGDAPPMMTADGRYVTILAVQPEQYRALIELVGDADLASERFATAHARAEHKVDFARIVGAWVARHEAEELMSRLIDAGVPASQVNTVADLAQHPHVQARGDIATLTNADGQLVALPGVVPRLCGAPGQVRWLGEPLGASNDYVYRELLGLSVPALDRLRADGVV
jgi:crotonobetainyl-CoA:carnitine CoA-transferase CaiB-like acyl-CoA transferase